MAILEPEVKTAVAPSVAKDMVDAAVESLSVELTRAQDLGLISEEERQEISASASFNSPEPTPELAAMIQKRAEHVQWISDLYTSGQVRQNTAHNVIHLTHIPEMQDDFVCRLKTNFMITESNLLRAESIGRIDHRTRNEVMEIAELDTRYERAEEIYHPRKR